jgi:tetratricopeptide (TPR) repeat protein
LWQNRPFRVTVMVVLTAVLIGWLIKSQLPQWMARWHRYSATQHALAEEYEKAIEACDRALAWQPDSPDLHETRADIQLQAGNPQEALKDCNALLRVNPDYPPGYQLRARVHQLLGQYGKAIEDAKTLQKWLGEENHEGYNELAYMRAVANPDAKELEQAHQEIEKALKLLGRDPAEKIAGEEAQETDRNFGNYLDTRGYIFYRQGKYQEALADVDKAISLILRFKEAKLAGAKGQAAVQQQLEKRYQATLRIMYQHRGLVREKLGDMENAKADKDKARELGYDPKRDGE